MGTLTQRKTGENRMLKLVSVTIAGALVCGIAFTSTSAKAADEPDKAAVQKATTDCRAEVKEMETPNFQEKCYTMTGGAGGLRSGLCRLRHLLGRA